MHPSDRAMYRPRTNLIAVLAFAGLAAFVVHTATATDTTPQASDGHSWHRHHYGAAGRFMHVLKQLNLSTEQQTQIKSIFAASKPQFHLLSADMRSNAAALTAMAPTDPAYPALLATVKANAAARIQQMSDVKSQIFTVLTPAQQEKIPQIIAADKVRWQQRHQNSAPVAITAAPFAAS